MMKLLVYNFLYSLTPKLPSQRNFMSCNDQKSQGRHGYHEDVEKGVNQQIVAELTAGYTYLSMSAYFGRSDIALPGCHAFFSKMYLEEQDHALKLIDYQNMRGGRVDLCPISVSGASDDQDWKSICNAITASLKMEKDVKDSLEKLLCMAEQHKDVTTVDLLSSAFIPEQDRSICELARLLSRATKMLENGMGEYLFDRALHNAFVVQDKGSKPFGVSEVYK